MFTELLKAIALALDRAGVPYMIFGAQAVLLYGEPRITRDIDVTLGVGPDQPGPVLAVISEMGLRVLVDDPKEFLEQTFVLPAQDASGVRIDFVFSLSQFEQQAIARARIVPLDGVEVRFVSMEDLIVQKIVAGRPRDLDDAKNVIRKNPGFDRAFVEDWLGQFDQELDTDALRSFRQVVEELRD